MQELVTLIKVGVEAGLQYVLVIYFVWWSTRELTPEIKNNTKWIQRLVITLAKIHKLEVRDLLKEDEDQ